MGVSHPGAVRGHQKVEGANSSLGSHIRESAGEARARGKIVLTVA
jgi:hypothetical protein